MKISSNNPWVSSIRWISSIIAKVRMGIARVQPRAVHSMVDGNTGSPKIRQARAAAAIAWRKSVRMSAVLFGFGAFAYAQYCLAKAIQNEQYSLIAALLLGAVGVIFLLRNPLNAVLVWIVVSPFSTYLLQQRGSGGWNILTFDSVVFFFLFVVCVFKALSNRVKVHMLSWGESGIILFVIYVVLSIFFRGQATPNNLKIFALQIGIWPLIYFLIKASIRNEDDIRKCLVALSVSAAVISASMWYEHFTGKSMYSLIFGVDINLRWGDVGTGRAVGPFLSPIHSAQLLVPCVFFSLQQLLSSRQPRGKLLYGGLMAAILAAIFFTYTRNNYISLIIFIVMMPFLAAYRRQAYISAVAVFLLIVLIVIVPTVLSSSDLTARFSSDTVSSRVIYMKTSINMIRNNLLFGVGWGNSAAETPKYVVDRRQYDNSSGASGQRVPSGVHNTYLFTTQENGIIGAFFYYFSILAFFVQTVRTYLNAPAEASLGKNFLAVIIISVVMWWIATLAYANVNASYANGLFWTYFALASRYRGLLLARQYKDHNSNGVLGGAAVCA